MGKERFNTSYMEMRRRAILRKSEVKRYIIRGLVSEKKKKKISL